MPHGTLYVVATPIGNLRDITLRALDVLARAGALACEDTRHTQKLLSHYKIHPQEIFSVHKFNERSRCDKVLGLLEKGVDVALVSDAGTPTLSDPGGQLIAQVRERGIRVEPIPGPSAIVAALCCSGLQADAFLFDGFLPRKGKERRERFVALQNETRTLVFFETPHRLVASLADAAKALGDRKVVLARELTKLHEEIVHGTLEEIRRKVEGLESVRGEIVLMIEGCKAIPDVEKKSPQETIKEAVALCHQLQTQSGLSRKDAMREAAQRCGIPRRELYQILCKTNDTDAGAPEMR